MKQIDLNKIFNKSNILIFIGAFVIFFNKTTVYGIDILVPTLSMILIAYTTHFFYKKKEYDFLTIVTVIILLLLIVVKTYLMPYESFLRLQAQ